MTANILYSEYCRHQQYYILYRYSEYCINSTIYCTLSTVCINSTVLGQ
jgi:hypothetical protein